MSASVAMAGLGAVATGVTYARKDQPAIWLTLGYFTIMEALQIAGYLVIDQCGTPSNRWITGLSYLHIVFQPIFINALALELVPVPIKLRVRGWVFAAAGLASALMLAQILPLDQFGSCMPGTALCSDRLCTVMGNWHLAWEVPYNGLLVPLDRLLGLYSGFPAYMLAAFVMPLIYGAWRFVLMHAVAGPILSAALTDNPFEMPAIWCLFSIAIIMISLSPMIRRSVTTQTWWGVGPEARG